MYVKHKREFSNAQLDFEKWPFLTIPLMIIQI